ncbi:MAG: GC-type dockerin domain-anchored protein [Phycisphaerales bacterium]
MIVAGDLNADVVLTDNISRMSGTTANPMPTIRVDGSFNTGRLIVIGDELEGPGGGYIGGIEIGDTAGLGGQVIINANATTSGLWSGDISVGASTLDPSVATAYTTPSTSLGGGAVGLVPYRLYASDCFPRHDDNWLISTSEPYIMNSELNGTRPDLNGGFLPKVPAKMSFYGPIASSSTSPPVRVWIWLHNTYWMDVTDHCDVSISGRSISISAASGHTLSAGYYAALAQTSPGPDALVCLGTFASTPPSVAPNTLDASGNPVAQYNFYVFPDCDSNGVIDSTGSGQYCGPCVADCDDGTGTGTPDGGVTIDDLLYYYAEFQNGSIFADIDDGSGTGVTDGGVTIDDLLYYITRFQGGC